MSRFTHRVWIVIGSATAAVLLLVLLWFTTEVLLLMFAGVLAAVFLRGLSHALSKRTGLSEGWSSAIVLTLLVLVAVLGGWLLVPRLASQVDELWTSLGGSFQQVNENLARYEWGRRLLNQAPDFYELSQNANLFSRISGVFSTTLGVLANTILVAFIGLFIALRPKLYTDGLLRLIPPRKRDRAREVMADVDETLRNWLLGRALLMAVNGVLTAIGLWLLGIPMALTLGIIAGLLNFVPNIGPIVAAIPAVLIAWPQGQAVPVLILYVVLQMADGYLLTPLVQQRTVSLAPALILVAQLLFAILAGTLGLLLATPITAAALVLVRRLYLEDVLGEKRGRTSPEPP